MKEMVEEKISIMNFRGDMRRCVMSATLEKITPITWEEMMIKPKTWKQEQKKQEDSCLF